MVSVPSAEVVVRDVGPRDGLQSVGATLPTQARISLVRSLAAAGLSRIEVGSFVSARAVPQMADTESVLAGLDDLRATTRLETLVVNERGAGRAIEAGSETLVLVVAASDTFSRRNVRMGTDDALTEAGRIMARARAAGVTVVADVATAFGCAYEGPVPAGRVDYLADALLDLGVDELVLADTTGMAGPPDITDRAGRLRRRVGADFPVGLHLHDTRGLGLVNAYAGLDAGIRLFDSSVGGIGGCPFSPGATGNVGTEDLVHMLEILGVPTGIDLGLLLAAARQAEHVLGFTLPSRLLRSGPRSDVPATALAGR
jgi:hydroxymethylglutaryl-CoA lyase